jgi:hypothetical protein
VQRTDFDPEPDEATGDLGTVEGDAETKDENLRGSWRASGEDR